VSLVLRDGFETQNKKARISANKIWSWTFDRLAQGVIQADMP
jgi:hypothetical protein